MITPGLQILLLILITCPLVAQKVPSVKTTRVGTGWARNSVNTVVFRKNSLVTHDSIQFIAFYNDQARVILGKRTLGDSTWTLGQTPYSGNASDAHNAINLMVDGEGYLHMAWDHHNTPLQYVRSKNPVSLELGEPKPMTGLLEERITYTEFYKLPDGDLLFLYRNGESGKGNLVINKYDLQHRKWSRIQDNLIDGQGERNAYWQACVDDLGTIHLSWVWRESPDVASNHDMCYAKSADGGVTWEQSSGSKYRLPITAETAEYICRIPQNSQLINQTSMTTNEAGEPLIVSYWAPEGTDIPQYHVIWQDGATWNLTNTAFRTLPFDLGGMGTRQIPISRPQLVMDDSETAYLIFRDTERNSRISVARGQPAENDWEVFDLTMESYGSWEPTLDTELWKQAQVLHLFVQQVTQVSGEGLAQVSGTPVLVLEWKPGKAERTD